MLAAQRTREGWHEGVAGGAGAILGWCGWLALRTASVEGVDVVLDGTIFNRRDFEPAASGAALIANLYRKHGFAGSLALLNGDFAIALHDATAGTTWLARDRFGVKPLYYVASPDRFAFASRPVALLALPWVGRDLNRRFVAMFAASHYRYFDNVPEESPYNDIAQLPAAHLLRWCDRRVAVEPYWALEEADELTDPEAALADRYRDLLLDAVTIRARDAEQPAFTLSGGMDSSSVLACAVRASGERQVALSTVYDDPTYDEREDVKSMLESAVSTWHTVVIGQPDVVADVRRMVALHDEPIATATWLSHYLLCGRARDLGTRTLFGGLGGDELNAGEYEYFYFFFADLASRGETALLDQEIAQWVRHHDHPIFRKSRAAAFAGIDRLADLSHLGVCLADRHRMTRYAGTLVPGVFDFDGFQPRMDHPFTSYLKNRTFQDMFRETLPCCLRAEDRHTTAHDMEHVTPFLDHRLSEFMFRVAGANKIRGGVTKHLLREAMRGILPEATRRRIKKTGWNAPAHQWFCGAGRAVVQDIVRSQSFRDRGVYDPDAVEAVLDEHDRIVSSGAVVDNHMMFLWQVVNLELWLRWVDDLPVATA